MPPKDPEARAAYMREYYRKNKDKFRAYSREWTAKNREAERERQRRYYQEHKAETKARLQRQQEADPEGYKRRKREAARQWRLANPERARENARRSRVRRDYGLTLEEYDVILARGCAICGSHKGRVVGKASTYMAGRPPARLCLDHDHANGRVRAALCHSCNSGLGLFEDDPVRLRAAADYVATYRATK